MSHGVVIPWEVHDIYCVIYFKKDKDSEKKAFIKQQLNCKDYNTCKNAVGVYSL